jgi:rfaE bifunctional protein kinase chain/domain
MLLDALHHFPSLSAGVIGDMMVDRFLYGEAERISPEAPVPVVRVREQVMQPGGAANVGRNVLSLGAKLALFGVLGDDDPGRSVRDMLADSGAQLPGLLLLPDRPSTLKTRVVAQSQQLVRFDEEESGALNTQHAAELLRILSTTLPWLNVVVLSDYAKGVLKNGLAAQVITMAHSRGLPVVADPKPLNIAAYADVDVVKPNLGEARQLAGDAAKELTPPELCRAVLERSKARSVVVTAGGQGMYVLAAGQFTHLPSKAREVYDVAGAGDTTLAALALGLASGLPLVEAARLGNLAGSIAVGKLGTSAVSYSELRAAVEGLHGAA